MAFSFLWYLFFVPEIFKFSYYANLITDCAIVQVHWCDTKLRISLPIMQQCHWSNAVVPYEIYHMVHILMLLWQHARFQSPASSKLNITICDSTRQNTRSYLRCMPVPPSLDLLFNFFNCIFCPMQVQMVIFDFEEEGTGRETILRLTWCTQCSKVCMNFKRSWNGQSCGGFRPWENP